MKRTFFALLIAALLLAACGSASYSEAPGAAPAMDYDGGYYDEETKRFYDDRGCSGDGVNCDCRDRGHSHVLGVAA